MARSRPVTITALLLVLMLGLGPLVVHFFVPAPAALELELHDATFGDHLAGKSVKVVDDAYGRKRTAQVEVVDNREIVQFLPLPSGPLHLRVETDGFQPVSLPIELPPLGKRRASLDLESLSGRLHVTVVDATTLEAIPTAVLSPSGEPRSDEFGQTLLLPAGVHRLNAQAAGYCQGEQEVRITAGQELEIQLPISPELTSIEAARAVLDWAENPRDLDAHILLETTEVEVPKPHVYFSHKKGTTATGETYAELDVDYVHSEGFETMTLSSRVPGTYRYFVHLYAGEGTLGTSGATVRVSTRGCKQKTYRVPSDCIGRFWNVVDIRVGETVDILERRECSDEPPRRWMSRKRTS